MRFKLVFWESWFCCACLCFVVVCGVVVRRGRLCSFVVCRVVAAFLLWLCGEVVCASDALVFQIPPRPNSVRHGTALGRESRQGRFQDVFQTKAGKPKDTLTENVIERMPF